MLESEILSFGQNVEIFWPFLAIKMAKKEVFGHFDEF